MSLFDDFMAGVGKALEGFVGATAAQGTGNTAYVTDTKLRQDTTIGVSEVAAAGYKRISQVGAAAVLTADWKDPGGTSLDWRTNWRNAEYTSPGQAIVAGYNNLYGAKNTGSSPREQVNAAITQKRSVGYVDDTTGQWRPGFKNNMAGNLVSGSADAVYSWFLDPTVLGGKAVKAGRRAVFTRPVTSAAGVEKAVAKIETRAGGWGAAVSSTQGMSTSQMLNLDWVRSATDPDFLASTLRSVADDADEVTDYAAKSEVLRAALGHKPSLDKLRVEKPAIHDALMMSEEALKAARRLPNGSMAPGELDRLTDVYNDLLKRDKLLSRLVNDADPNAPTRAVAGTLGGERTVSMIGPWERAKAGIARTNGGNPELGFSQKVQSADGQFIYETVKPGPGQRAVKVMRWTGEQRPSGFVAVSGAPVADSSREVVAFARLARMGDNETAWWVDKFTGAFNDSARAQVARELEETAWVRVAADYGLDSTTAKTLYNTMNGRRAAVIEDYKNRVFGIEDDGSFIVDPMLMSQLADSVPMFDIANLRHMLRDETKSGNIARFAGVTGVDALEYVQSRIDTYWRPLVLIRGGYAPRNLFEGSGRVLFTLPEALGSAVQGTPRFFANRGRGVANKVDDVFAGSTDDLMSEVGELGRQRALLVRELEQLDSATPTLFDDAGILAAADAGFDLPPGYSLSRVEADQSVSGYQYFHGTSKDWVGDDGIGSVFSANSYDNLYGPGLYTTDSPQIAASYRRKGSSSAVPDGADNSAVYGITPDAPVNALNLDATAPDWLKEYARGLIRQVNDLEGVGDFDEFMHYLDYSHIKSKDVYTTLKTVFGENLGFGQRELADEMLHDLASAIRAKGYNALTHTGGKVTGGAEHKVTIFLGDEITGATPPLTRVGDAGLPPRGQPVKAPAPAAAPATSAVALSRRQVEVQERLAAVTARAQELSTQLDARASTKAALTTRSVDGTGTMRLGKNKVEAPDAFAGPAGRMGAVNSSSAGTRKATFEPAGNRASGTLGDWGSVNPGDPNYFDAFGQVVRQLVGDPIAIKLMQGGTPAQVTAWLRSSAGRDVRRSYPGGMSATERVGTVAGLLQRYVPESAWGDVLSTVDTPLTSGQWAAKLASLGDELPVIHGRRFTEEMSRLSKIKQQGFKDGAWRPFVDKAFTLIGSLPEDRLLRHPFYRATYRAEMKRLAKVWEGQGGQIDDNLVREWSSLSHKRALLNTKNTLYTIERYSNIGFFGRFLAPFIQAQANTLRTWGRIIGRDPSVLARLNLAWQGPSNLGVLWDQQENRPVPAGQNIGLDDRYKVLIPIPKSWTDKIGATNPDDPMSQITFAPSQTSFNVALQSDPFWSPGQGPLATVPTAYLANEYPDSPFISWVANKLVFPTGSTPSSPITSLLPAWIRQTMNSNSEDSAASGAVYARTLARERQRFRDGERSSEPTPDEIKARVDAWFYIRIAGSASLPFSAEMRDPVFQFYTDESRRYRQQYGFGWFDKFMADYPQYGEYAFTLSKNDTGIRAVRTDVANAKTYADLIADVSTDYPGLIGAITNDGSPYEFDSPSYNWQKDRPAGPSTKFRDSQSAEESVDEAQIRVGWYEYRTVRLQRDALLKQRGLSPDQIASDPQIKAVWDQWLAGQEAKYPKWSDELRNFDGSRFTRTARAVDKVLTDDKFMRANGSKPEWQAVGQYMQSRQQMLDLLAQRKSTGGSGSFDAKQNSDIAERWTGYVNGLVQSNTRFNDIYVRYFEGEFQGRPDAGTAQ